MKISVERYRATDSIRKSLKKKLVSSRSVIPILVIGSLILLACLHVWQRVYVMGLVKEVSVLEKRNKELTDIVKKANLEILELSSLSRIEKIAGERLDMSGTRSENIFTLTFKESQPGPEGLHDVISSLQKVADHLPTLSESNAETIDIFETDESQIK
jgi:cell division protein FtsL